MRGRILYVDCNGCKPLPPGESLRILGFEYKITSVTNLSSADRAMADHQIQILVTNTPNFVLLGSFRKKHPKGKAVLVTSMPMKEYSDKLMGKEDELVDHVVSNSSLRPWATHDLGITINKILSEDIFGIDKYLSSDCKVHTETVTSSLNRDFLNNKVYEFAKACHLGQHTSRMAFGISEELLMNTIYDAPAAAGVERFQGIDQTTAMELKPEEYGELTFGCDGKLLAISCSDPFGALQKSKVFYYLKKVLKRGSTEGLIDTKKGGAGLGFFKILYSSHGIVCNVEKACKTEIIALIDVHEQLRDFSIMPRSIHFFDKDNAEYPS